MSTATVIIPTYCEAANIAEMVERLSNTCPGVDILVVDDDSPDGTAQLASEHGCRVLKRTTCRGLSSAVMEGVKLSNGTVLVIDGDLQHPPELAGKMLKALDTYDLVIASRNVPGGGVEGWSKMRILVSAVANILAAPFVPRIKDRTTGCFAFHTCILDGVTINATGFKIALEVMSRGHYKSFVEVPYIFVPRVAGTSKLSSRQITEYLKQLMTLPILRQPNLTIVKGLKFLVAGSGGAVITFAVTYGLTEFGHLWYMFSVVTGTVFGALWNFVVNALWTFRRQV